MKMLLDTEYLKTISILNLINNYNENTVLIIFVGLIFLFIPLKICYY